MNTLAQQVDKLDKLSRKMLQVCESMLKFNVANLGRDDAEFIRGYSFPHGAKNMPLEIKHLKKVVEEAKQLLNK